jgi:uncharacterized RDD family membrane protein YckC
MKCPKCGYLGFETTDRCRNCQYDFSLAPFSSEPELTLHGTDRHESPSDFELPSIARQSDKLNTGALDLDRLFGDAESSASARADSGEPRRDRAGAGAAGVGGHARTSEPTITVLDDDEDEVMAVDDADVSMAADEPLPVALDMDGDSEPDVSESQPMMAASSDAGALPFEDGPIVPPPAARTPLAVRRSTPEVPRNRPRTTRPVRSESLDFEPDPSSSAGAASQAASETVASLMELPSLGARVGAGAIDLLLLVGIHAMVLYLTLRVTGLQNSLDDLRVLPPVPFIGFLATLAFGYVAAFTVAGGQTIGKMVLSLRVIGDDGRPVDAAGGMLRALGCMLVPITLGLSYLPALFTSDHRAIHDRLAGTRVVQE